MSVRLFLFLSDWASLCLSACLSACLFAYLSACLFVCLPFCMSVYLPVPFSLFIYSFEKRHYLTYSFFLFFFLPFPLCLSLTSFLNPELTSSTDILQTYRKHNFFIISDSSCSIPTQSQRFQKRVPLEQQTTAAIKASRSKNDSQSRRRRKTRARWQPRGERKISDESNLYGVLFLKWG